MNMPKILSGNFDTLVVGFGIYHYESPDEFEKLSEAKAKAGESMFSKRGSEVTFYGKRFKVSARGARGYEWVLENSDITLCIAQKAQAGRVFPELYVTFRSEYLWREGYYQAFNQVEDWIGTWAGVVYDRISRADLCVDIQMAMPVLNLKVEAVSRARGKVEYYEPCERYTSGLMDTGYKLGSGKLVTRIYDKTTEIIKTRKDWFKDIWKQNGWDEVTPVIRVEFQARRELLKEFEVDTFDSLCQKQGDLWSYYTEKWLVFRVPTEDSLRNRWPVRDWWELVQVASGMFGQAYGQLRRTAQTPKYEALIKQAWGCLVSAAALECSRSGLDSAMLKIERDIGRKIQTHEFMKEVLKRSAGVSMMQPIIYGMTQDENISNDNSRLL
jgi:hypothetical protein